MPSSGLAGVAGREALSSELTRVARADLDVAVAHARVEAVERAHRRAAGDLAVEVVDAAVARADEALGGLDVADRAAEVHAARRDGDERRCTRRFGRAVDRSGCACACRRSSCRPRRCPRTIGDRSAARRCRRGSRRRRRRPASVTSCCSKIAGRGRSRARAARRRPRRWRPAPCAVAGHEAPAGDGLALEGAGDLAGRRCTWTSALASSAIGQDNTDARARRYLEPASRNGVTQGVGRRERLRSAGAPRARGLAASVGAAPPWPTAAAPASQPRAARSGSPSACACALSEMTSASSATASRSPSAARRARPSA